MKILDNVNYPEDIKKLSLNELESLADEIRSFLITSISKTGGHLASNLGIVELTIALDRAFTMPEDKIIWDVGHQAYVHKMLTGRKNRFATLRKYGGMSGFPKPSESKYDMFATGHSSTSLSAALGMATARDIKGEKYNVIAVIGDGALTGGMALEALNDIGATNTNIIVVLNDNEMSIAPNVGSIASYLSKIRTDPAYLNLKIDVENILKRIPAVGSSLYKSMERLKESLKCLLVQGMVFEELGYTYLGPINGHNIQKLTEVFERCKKIKGPVLIHIVTKKGKGYSYAEKNPDRYHGVGPFDITTGEIKSCNKITYSEAFGEEIINEAKVNDKIVAITAAMPDGTGLKNFSKIFPKRFFDVGIAEQHAVTFAAGLAANGMKPVFAVYSTFLQRAYDQVIHDVCLQNLPVLFAIDRAGVVGEDGETHQGVFDISFLHSIPNITILSPKDIAEFRMMLKWCFKYEAPCAIRYPKGSDEDVVFETYDKINKGQWEILNEGKTAAILSVGKTVQFAFEANNKLKQKGINCDVINCRFIKPIDEAMLDKIMKKHDIIFTVEDNYKSGGFGSMILGYAANKRYKGNIIVSGYPDEFIPHGSRDILYKKYGIDADGLIDTILKNL